MLAISVSSFWSKFQIYFPQNDSAVFEAHGDLSELDGYQVVPAKFAIYPSKDSEFHSKSRRSCFNLLTRLLQNENNGAVLSKENIIANLLNNTELIDSLKNSNDSESISSFDPHLYKIVISIESDKELYRIPTHDFACVRHLDSLIICTAQDENSGSDYFYLKIRNFSPELESAIKSFMVNPLTSINVSNGFDLLPSMDMSNIISHSQGFFENFIDDTAQASYNSASTTSAASTSNHENNGSRTKASTSSPSRLAKKNDTDTTKIYSNPFSRQCLNCFCTSTPMWRRGPDGTASLCNACGVKFKSGKLQMSAELVETNLKKIRQSSPSSQAFDSKENFDGTIDNDQTTNNNSDNNNYNDPLESNLILHQY